MAISRWAPASRPEPQHLHREPDDERSGVLAILAVPHLRVGGPADDALPDPESDPGLSEAILTRLRPFLREGETGVADIDDHHVRVHLSREPRRHVSARLEAMCRALSLEPFSSPDGSSHWVRAGTSWSHQRPRSQAARASHLLSVQETAHAASRLGDLVARRVGTTSRRARRSHVTGLLLQILAASLISLVLPFLVLVTCYRAGLDLSSFLYWFVVAALAFTASLIWIESLHALTPEQPPPATSPPPPATAIVAAYLPNEADTILDTLHTFLAHEYRGGLQVILAYNTPRTHPIEDELSALAHTDPRLVLLRVEGSTSKAQNVNAAMPLITGEFVGIFDADHHPMPGAFERAWQWIGSGTDVVQGHCVVRNGAHSLLARMVAVEFEQIYAVSHPGRASMHGFGLFGGSNGFWRTSVIRAIRMRTDRLTEDIDCSIRATREGHRIVSDPGLVSLELAPVSVPALWRQRMRWAQGWVQVSARYLLRTVTSPTLTLRQRCGVLVLLGWRELYPWISPLPIPLLAFLAWRDGVLHWSAPLFLMTTLFTLVAGPLQVMFAWRLAVPSIRQHPWWFVGYLVFALVFYTEAKNMAMRVAQLKHLCGEREWTVTPRDQRGEDREALGMAAA